MLNVADIRFSFQDGFGEPSLVIYFQGCKFHCKGCYNPELWDFEPKNIYTPEELIQEVNQNKEFYDTVVLLGGEPLHQDLNSLTEFLKLLKQNQYKVILYTGYELKELKKYKFLEYVDIIKCGQYIEELKTDSFPASSNQKVYINKGGAFQDVTNTIYYR